MDFKPRIMAMFDELIEVAHSNSDKGRLIAYSTLRKKFREHALPIHTASDAMAIKGVGPSTMEKINRLIREADESDYPAAAAAAAAAASPPPSVIAQATSSMTSVPVASAKHGSAVAAGAAAAAAACLDATVKGAPPLLLAQMYDKNRDPTGLLMSEKLDGVRCYWNGKQLVSRQGNIFNAPNDFLKSLPTNVALDGELWMGRKTFEEASGTARSGAGDGRWASMRFAIFDAFELSGGGSVGGGGVGRHDPYTKRYELATRVAARYPAVILLVKHERCEGPAHLTRALNEVVEHGGEGLMLRDPSSVYEGKRSWTLMKVKRAYDAEARVVGHKQGYGKRAGKLGALMCQSLDGVTFGVGTGFSDEDCADYNTKYPIGCIITYKFESVTNNGKPKFAAFVRKRTDVTQPTVLKMPEKYNTKQSTSDASITPSIINHFSDNNNNTNNNNNNNNSFDAFVDSNPQPLKKVKANQSTSPATTNNNSNTNNNNNNNNNKPKCKFWDKCYRNNPKHFVEFRHPSG